MLLMAEVTYVVTRPKYPSGELVDGVRLLYKGRIYFVDAPVGELTVGQEVAVKEIDPVPNGAPGGLRLAS